MRAAGDEAQLVLVAGSIAAKLGSILATGSFVFKQACWLLLVILGLGSYFGLEPYLKHLNEIAPRLIGIGILLGAIAVLPAIFIIGLGRCVVGWDLLIAGAARDIKLRQVPYPDHETDLVTLNSSSRMFFGLIHSIYENQQCAPLVANWIAKVQRAQAD